MRDLSSEFMLEYRYGDDSIKTTSVKEVMGARGRALVSAK